MSFINKRSWRIKQGPNKRRSSIQIKQNMLINFNRGVEKIKISPINDKKTDKKNNSLYENCKIDYERKNKAKRCLLYLLNIKSKGTFCPEIVDYFKKIKESKIKEDEFNEIKEEKLDKSKKFESNINKVNPHIILPKIENQKIERKVEIKYENNKNESKDKKIDISEENNIINNHDEINFDFKDFQNIIIDNNKLKNQDNLETIINYNKDSQDNNNNDINEGETADNKNTNLYLNEKKIKKNSKKKYIKKENKIDTIYNLQRSELQKYGNYHLSLKSAIQSNLGKKKKHKKK